MGLRTAWKVFALVGLFVMGGSLCAVEPAGAVQQEVREFLVRVDGQPAGRCRLTTIHFSAHLVSMTAVYRIQVMGGPAVLYSYTNQDRETWKDGRLDRLESRGVQDGRPFTVRAARRGSRFLVQANGQADRTGVGLGTTACWQLPTNCPDDGILPLIDAATGQQLGIHFLYLGTDRLSVGKRTNECRHFELGGPGVRHAWYDALDRLVRLEQDINGQHLVLELVRVH